MNEDLRKRNKRNNLIILVVGIVIIIGIIAGTYSANMINGYVWALLMDKRVKK